MGKLTDRSELTAPALGDFLHVVDVSDTTDSPAGTSKKSTLNSVLASAIGKKTVLVNVPADLPAPSAGVRTLVANTNYVIGDDVNVGADRFDVSAGNISITSGNLFGPTLTSTTTGAMFTGDDSDFNIFNCRLNCPNGEVFNFSDTTPGTTLFLAETIIIQSCIKVGTFENCESIIFNNSSALSTDDGVSVVGSSLIVSFSEYAQLSSSASFIGLDLGSSTNSVVELTNFFNQAPSGAIGISGLANSANINSGFVASVVSCEFFGGMTALSGISDDDFRWFFSRNSTNIQNTMPRSFTQMNGNVTATVIPSAGTDVKVAGTFSEVVSSHFTTDATGRITSISESPLSIIVDILLSAQIAVGTDNCSVSLALNGTVIADSAQQTELTTGDPRPISTLWMLTVNETDFLEVFVRNDDTDENITVTDAKFRVRV